MENRSQLGGDMLPSEFAKCIDQTLLSPDAGPDDITDFCLSAARYNFASVVVHPVYVELARNVLHDSEVKVGTVIGFPFGANTTASKMFEAVDAVARGATELDMVLNIAALCSDHIEVVYADIRAVVEEVRRKEVEFGHDVIVKVIIETGFLSKRQKMEAASVVEKGGADFVKTSTGYGPGGATVEDIRILRKTVSPEMGVKASGGVRTLKQAEELLAAGANRIGTSAGVDLMDGFMSRRDEPYEATP